MDANERVRESFEAQPFMGYVGARLHAVSAGACEIRLPFRAELTQQHGFFHGGVIATLADNAGGFAGFSLMAADEQPLSVEFKINLLAKGVGQELRARAQVLQNGRRLKVTQTEIFAWDGEVETRVAIALVTVIATQVRSA